MDRYRITYTEAQAARTATSDEPGGVTQETVYAKAMSEPGQTVTFLDANDDTVLMAVTAEIERIEKLDDDGKVVDTVLGEPKRRAR